MEMKTMYSYAYIAETMARILQAYAVVASSLSAEVVGGREKGYGPRS
jgi:hypothetical protein